MHGRMCSGQIPDQPGFCPGENKSDPSGEMQTFGLVVPLQQADIRLQPMAVCCQVLDREPDFPEIIVCLVGGLVENRIVYVFEGNSRLLE